MAIELADRANKNFDILNRWNETHGTPAKGDFSYFKLPGISEKPYGTTAFIIVIDYTLNAIVVSVRLAI